MPKVVRRRCGEAGPRASGGFWSAVFFRLSFRQRLSMAAERAEALYLFMENSHSFSFFSAQMPVECTEVSNGCKLERVEARASGEVGTIGGLRSVASNCEIKALTFPIPFARPPLFAHAQPLQPNHHEVLRVHRPRPCPVRGLGPGKKRGFLL